MKQIYIVLAFALIALNAVAQQVMPEPQSSFERLAEVAADAQRTALAVTNVTDCESVTDVAEDMDVETSFQGGTDMECRLSYFDVDAMVYTYRITKTN
jgi:hypothetical protein